MNRKPCLLAILALLVHLGYAQTPTHNHDHGNNSSSKILMDKIKSACHYFGADTLEGFPLEATITEAVRKYPMYTELLPYMRQLEIAFVKKKYHLSKLPGEIDPALASKTIPTVLASTCNNLDFENGNFSSWTGGKGYNANTHNPLTITGASITTLGMNSPETSCSPFTIVSTGTDPYGGFPMVDPGGGTYACRLGGDLYNLNCDAYNSAAPNWIYYGGPSISNCYSNCNSSLYSYSNGETMQQTFAVTAANCLFSYKYAVVIADAPHTGANNPFFSVQVYNQSGVNIPCLSYFVEADTTGAGGIPPGFLLSGTTDQLGNSVLYTPWTSASLNLQPYIGTNVTIKFTTAGCTAGGHFAYAYVDASCGPLQLIVPSGEVCLGGNESLVGPANAGGTYSWSGPGVVSGATSQTVTCNQPGTYSVTVTNAKGCSYVLDTTIAFYPKPTVTASNVTVCPNNTVTLNANSTGSAGQLTYTWTPSTGLSVTNDSTTTANVGSTTTYTVTGISAHNCTNTAAVTVTVPPAPPPTFNAAPVCLGQPTVINNTTGGGGTFSWNFGDGSAVVNNVTSPSHTYTTSGTFVVSCTVNAGGCVGTNTANVVVNPSSTVTATSNTMCVGGSAVTITASGATSYTWNTGANTASISASPATTTTYTVTGANAAGCTSTATTAITVVSNPTITTTPTAICTGSTGTLTASGVTSYTWSGSSIVGSPNSATLTASPAATATYTVNGSVGSCTATATAVITVNPLPVPSFVSSVECLGTATSFTNNSTPAGSTYSWNLGDGNTSTAPAPSETYTAAGSYVVTLTATSPSSCTATVTGTVTVKPVPALSPVSNVTVCDQQTINVQSFTSTPGGATVGWTNSNATIGLAASGTGNINPFIASAGGSGAPVTGIVTATPTLAGCVGSPITFTLTVNPVPVPAFVSSVECLGTATSFTNNSTPAGSTYNWSLGDGNTSTLATPSETYTAAGSYVVTLTATAPGNCTASATGTVTVKPIPTLSPVSNVSVCDQQVINVQSFTSTPAGATTAWTNDNTAIGLSASGSGNINPFTGSANGSTGQINGVITATPTLAGCVGPPINFTLTVSPNPTVTLTAPPLTCPGQTVPAPTYTMNPNDPATQFSWTNNQTLTGMAANGNGIPTSFTAASNATLANITGTVVVTPTLGVCVGQPASYTVTIYPTPVINPIANIAKCPNQPVPNIALSVLPAGGTPSFAWSNSNTSIGLASSGTVTPIPGFTTLNGGTTQQIANISVGASLNGCPAVPVPFTITVNPNPIAAFSANNKICEGSPMSFTDQSTVGSGFINTWSWNLDLNAPFSTTQNSVYTIPTAGQHTVTLTATTDQGCVNVVSHTVYINPIPVALFTGGGQGCPVLTVSNFLNGSTVPDGTNIHSVSWDFGNGASYSATAPTSLNPSGNLLYGNSSPTLNATYTVSLVATSDSGCVSPSYSKPCVTVWPHPLPGFSYGPVDPAPDIDNPIVYFYDQSQGASGPNGLLWNLGDVFAGNAQSNYTNVQNPIHSYEHYDPYTYYVTQWVSNIYGCKDSLTKPIEILPNWTFYIPNAFSPNGDGVNEGFKGTGVGIDTTTYNIWIFDRWGMQIFYSDDMEKVWDGRIQGKSGDIVQEDVYVWKVKFHDFLGRKHEYKGTVSVIK